MAYFVFFALTVAFLSSAYATGVQCNQDPHPAMIGGLVNVTCTGAHTRFSENLEWKLPNGTRIDAVPGVEGIKTTNSRKLANATLSLNLTDFPAEKKVSCGLNDTFVNYTICVSWSIIHPPRNVTVHGADDSVKITCAIVQDCTTSPNPWFSHNGAQVDNSTDKGIAVTHKWVAGTKDTVVEWELAFTNLTQKEIFGNYTCRASPSLTATAKLEKADDNPPESSTISPTSSRVQHTVTSGVPSLLPTPFPSVSSAIELYGNSMTASGTTGAPSSSPPQPTTTTASSGPPTTTGVVKSSSPSPSGDPASSEDTSTDHQPVGIAAVAVAIVVVLVIGGVVFMVYWKRHMLRDWLMEKDVVKVMKKGKRGKGYKYSKLPKDVSTSMKHLE